MPLIATRGAASAQGFGEFAQTAVATYIEDVFSTYLYTGTGTNVNRTITNGIDLSGEGGLVWTKVRNAAYINALNDTARGFSNYLVSENTGAQNQYGSLITMTANSDGYTMNDQNGSWNENNKNFVSWTFRKAEKFFDVVTYTGNGISGRTISHNLGSTPGCIIVKRTNTTSNWSVYHRGLDATSPQNYNILLNTTGARLLDSGQWNNTAPTSTNFTVGDGSTVNANGSTYVAYLFAHDAGGFGLTGLDNVITCGSYTGNGSSTGPTISLGYEPQWVLIKQATNAGTRWTITDNMRGFPVTSAAQQQILQPNVTDAEVGVMYIQPTSTGFNVVDVDADVNQSGATYIYIAIRRGPMKTPTTGTSVFAPVVGSSLNSSFVTDFAFIDYKPGGSGTYPFACARLNGNTYLKTSATSAELTFVSTLYGAVQNGIGNSSFTSDFVGWLFQRAPSFMDVVCYTGNGSTNSQTHNLGVIPDLVICKKRSGSAQAWAVYCQPGGTGTAYNGMSLNDNLASASSSNGNFTSTTFDPQNMFTSSGSQRPNSVGENYVAYLFATLAGVSKVGTYTGNGTSQTINCGFTNGSRFVMVKRASGVGDWFVWDSARGIVAGNDPRLALNDTNAEVTGADELDTDSSGFIVNQIGGGFSGDVNVNGATYIFLAIA